MSDAKEQAIWARQRQPVDTGMVFSIGPAVDLIELKAAMDEFSREPWDLPPPHANTPTPPRSPQMTETTTTPTPPEGLTDEDLMKLASNHWTAFALYSRGMSVEIYASELLAAMRAAIAADRAARPAPTPEEIEAQFRAWWAESYPSAPAGPHAVASHVAFGRHLLSRGVQ